MARKRHTTEDVSNKLREAEVGLARGLAAPDVCRKRGVAEQGILSFWDPIPALGTPVLHQRSGVMGQAQAAVRRRRVTCQSR